MFGQSSVPHIMASTVTGNQIALRIVVDKEKKRVLFAEAGKDFVDILLSFLTMPLGTIARLVNKDSNMKPLSFGCISSLYQSVGNLDHTCFRTGKCRGMLLQPRNPMEAYCRNLKLNIDDTPPTKYFACGSWECLSSESGVPMSTFKNQFCKCLGRMSSEIGSDSIRQSNDGFAQETAIFIIFDNLNVVPGDRYTTLSLLTSLGIDEIPILVSVNLSYNEVLDLLKCSLFSKAPLTDLFLHKKQHLENSKDEESSWFNISEGKANEGNRKMKVKVTIRKSDRKILYAQVGEDFIDQLLSFLTTPLGTVECVLQHNSGLGCIDTLYKSVVDLHGEYFKSEELKNILMNPGIDPQSMVNSQILPIHEACPPHYSCYSSKYRSGYLTASREYCKSSTHVCAPVTLVDPKIGGFVKGPSISMFMVTDDLSVKPFSFVSAVSFLNESVVSVHDLEERVVRIGVEEVLGILKAAMISSSALTNGLTASGFEFV